MHHGVQNSSCARDRVSLETCTPGALQAVCRMSGGSIQAVSRALALAWHCSIAANYLLNSHAATYYNKDSFLLVPVPVPVPVASLVLLRLGRPRVTLWQFNTEHPKHHRF